MKPVRSKKKNSCVQNSLASLLELRPSRVPDFYGATRNGFQQMLMVKEWLRRRGLALVRIAVNSHPECYHLAAGLTERGTRHMVVMHGADVANDSHPSQAGLIKVKRAWLVVPIDIGAR